MAIIFVSANPMHPLDLLTSAMRGRVDYVPCLVVPDLLRAKVRVFAELYRKPSSSKRECRSRGTAFAERTAESHAMPIWNSGSRSAPASARPPSAQVHEMRKWKARPAERGGSRMISTIVDAVLGNLNWCASSCERPQDPSC